MQTRVLLFPLLVGLGLVAVSPGDEPARAEVEVTMFVVPESLWRKRFQGEFDEHPALWLRLNADAAAGLVTMPVDFKFRLVGEEAVLQRKGSEAEFIESWDTWAVMDPPVRPAEKTKRFIGTSVELARLMPGGSLPMRIRLGLEHHVAPPVMRRINFANAATGVERDRFSVEYPQFEKIEWHGELSVWREWRLVANMLHLPVIPAKKGTAPTARYLVFIKRA